MKKYQVPRSAITERGLKKLIEQAAQSHSCVGEWAREHDITPQSISAFFRKTQGPGLKIPEVLGYRPQVVYLPLDEKLIQEPAAPRRTSSRPTSKVDHTKTPIEGRKKTGTNLTERDKTKARLKSRKAR